MLQIKRFKLFYNNNEKSIKAKDEVKEKLINNGFIEDINNFDLAIAIGGDGSFLRMVKNTNFNSNVLYVGINAGTLGFAQEVSIDEIDCFIDELKDGNYKVASIGVQETNVKTKDSDSNFYSLNEIVVREKELNTLVLDVNIQDVFLEEFIGDGMLISTSFGSTAYNLSFGGSIVYSTFHTLQLTPIAPLNNKSYRTLLNPVILPENKVITLIPKRSNDLLITIDGENKYYDNVIDVKTVVNKKRINCLRKKDYDFSKKINDKFLK
ncbi:MAG: NAD(+)/NADH kinase [Bacilli bacterium]|nr:NAD(+)/NADH kinase [Bacilli bacterium]